MAKQPTSVEIRSYQVGFGDCFLVSFVYDANDKRHVLIDFGTTGLPKRRKPAKPVGPSQHMPVIANAIAADCGGQLTAVVATHRHADHISGFGTDDKTGKSGLVIRSLKPKVVLQPWTEDPDAAEDAEHATRDSNRSKKSFVTGLAAMQDVAEMVRSLAAEKPAWMSAALQRHLAFVGEDNISNVSAVKNLQVMGDAAGAKAVWGHHGAKSGLERLLPGVKVRVLGPPTLEQSQKIRTMRQSDPDEFWQLLGSRAASATLPRIRRPRRGSKTSRIPKEARWFKHRLDRLRGEQLLEIVTALDDQMNNTSLILLFEVGGKKLLFPGDAQIENWSYALKDAPDAEETCARLAQVDFYKVGHHGSRNATPKTLWDLFAHRGKPGAAGRLRTMLSTLPGKHGSTAKKTEVPRRSLVDALEHESALQRTDQLKFGAKPELSQLEVIEI